MGPPVHLTSHSSTLCHRRAVSYIRHRVLAIVSNPHLNVASQHVPVTTSTQGRLAHHSTHLLLVPVTRSLGEAVAIAQYLLNIRSPLRQFGNA